MNSALKIVERWCLENGLTVNPRKTKLVLFTNKRKLNKVSLPMLNGARLEFSDHAKFLGLILDKKLNWKLHIEEKINKATKIYWQCRRAFGKTWGLKPKVVMWLYKSIIRPILCYGCHVWSDRVKTKSFRSGIEHVQRMVLLGVTGVMNSTPTRALETLLSILPIELFIEQEAVVTATRLKNVGCWKETAHGHATILNSKCAAIPELMMPSDKSVPLYRFEKNFNVHIPRRLEREVINHSGTNVFTDGSRMESGAGSGAYLLQ